MPATRVAAGSVVAQLGAIRLGEFTCPPADPLWSGVNWIGSETHVVFPRVPVRIRQPGAEEFVTTSNHVVVYASDDEYRRRPVAAVGDHCYFLALSSELIDELGLPAASRGLSDAGPDLFLQQRRLIAQARNRQDDLLSLEEQAIELAATALTGRRPWSPAATPSPHLVVLAERAKEVLGLEYAAAHRLPDLARLLDVSPYHLARSFRAVTGWSLHEYRTSLRLRAAADVLVDPATDLAALARATGFASHSHLTRAFRRQFGVTPSAARAELAA